MNVTEKEGCLSTVVRQMYRHILHLCTIIITVAYLQVNIILYRFERPQVITVLMTVCLAFTAICHVLLYPAAKSLFFAQCGG